MREIQSEQDVSHSPCHSIELSGPPTLMSASSRRLYFYRSLDLNSRRFVSLTKLSWRSAWRLLEPVRTPRQNRACEICMRQYGVLARIFSETATLHSRARNMSRRYDPPEGDVKNVYAINAIARKALGDVNIRLDIWPSRRMHDLALASGYC